LRRSRGKENQVADNIHGFATSGTDATFQTLPLYSDVQKRVRFTLCDEHMYTCYIGRMTLEEEEEEEEEDRFK
jgi:hypothetical protein